MCTVSRIDLHRIPVDYPPLTSQNTESKYRREYKMNDKFLEFTTVAIYFRPPGNAYGDHLVGMALPDRLRLQEHHRLA
jgi:hypothetical protein